MNLKKINNFLSSINMRSPVILLLVFGFSTIFVWNILINDSYNIHFIYLAESFLNGKLYFIHIINNGYDNVFYKGHYYWPEGPFPAVLLIPFVFLFGTNQLQGYVVFLLNLLNLLLLFRIAKKITNSTVTSLWLSFGYIFASSYLNISLRPGSAYFAQIVASSTLLFSLNEYFYAKRWFLVGLFLSFGIATRFDLVFAWLFFFILIVFKKQNSGKLKQLFELSSPVFITINLLLFYNWLRFDNPFEPGYFGAAGDPRLKPNKDAGLWSFIHFPANFYYLFLKGPDPVFARNSHILTFPFIIPDIWGLSILYTSPMFLWIFKVPWRLFAVKSSIFATLAILFFLLGYYGLGFTQIGYRYALDFYPFLFILLCYAVQKNISLKLRWVIVLSFLFNFYLILVSGF